MHIFKSKKNKEASDAELWKQFSEGDVSSLETIYDRHFYALTHYGYSFCNNIDLVKDCIQEVFSSFLSRTEIPEVTYVYSYLTNALRYRILTELHQKKIIDSLDDFSFDIPINDTELESIFASDDDDLILSKKIQDAYQSLFPNQRHAIYLRFIKEMSWKEMSITLTISEHSCMNLVTRSIAKLRQLVKQ